MLGFSRSITRSIEISILCQKNNIPYPWSEKNAPVTNGFGFGLGLLPPPSFRRGSSSPIFLQTIRLSKPLPSIWRLSALKNGTTTPI